MRRPTPVTREACYIDSLRRQNTSKSQAFSQGSEYSQRHLPASICNPQGILVLLVYLPKIISFSVSSSKKPKKP